MTKQQWVLVSHFADEDSVEAFGPFTSKERAEQLRDKHKELGVRPAYPFTVVELFPVRELQGQVRELERWDNE